MDITYKHKSAPIMEKERSLYLVGSLQFLSVFTLYNIDLKRGWVEMGEDAGFRVF